MASAEKDSNLFLELRKKSQPNMSEEQFTQWLELLEERTGMRLPESRASFLTTNIKLRMRELGFHDYQAYYDHILSGSRGKVEWDQLVDRLTVHETRFLRHSATFDLICQQCLPSKRPIIVRNPPTVNVWSVGCSSGEEPYSLAMAIDEHFAKLDYEYYLGIIASDISRKSLAKGREGTYSFEQLKTLNPQWLVKYFDKTTAGKFQVKSELRQRVCFNQLNILDIGKMPIGNMDVIVCQNVLIYYDRERRMEIVNTLVNYLSPGGVLALAVGEMVSWTHPALERIAFDNTLAFRKVI